MKWSEQTWQAIEERYQSILEMPFIKELSDGSLPQEKFRFYMAQDSLYLEHFGRTLSLIAAKINDLQDVLAFMRFAENAIVVENALHESYFKDFGLTGKGILEPACHHYIHFLRSTAAIESVEIAVAAVLPCFWIYREVGNYIYQTQNTINNPYEKWIATYAGEEFSTAVDQAISICDTIAENSTEETKKRMSEAFIMATRMEYYFWEAAYELKKWE
ncbi:transcriptional regulator [Chryseobacterium piperi]|uniref:Aminopyrimidine aminohydrolase n=1 Tax=Chryseobacterium piperi TaxID=558152 RepID=A0A086AZB4_9FLAO|nr:thiaminase II [Chryseobacterium piperi]ASW74535.1 thiaminase II [Chryseobacterium piperi]KFF22028.1 transcriptional regulator [Chryseobacterium piperi]